MVKEDKGMSNQKNTGQNQKTESKYYINVIRGKLYSTPSRFCMFCTEQTKKSWHSATNIGGNTNELSL